jgi:hypothetical protein
VLPEFVHRVAVVVLFAYIAAAPFMSHKCDEALTGRQQMLRAPARQGFCGKQAGQSGMQDSWDSRDSNAEIPSPGSYPQGRIIAARHGPIIWRQNRAKADLGATMP